MNQAQMHNTNVYRQVSVFLKKKSLCPNYPVNTIHARFFKKLITSSLKRINDSNQLMLSHRIKILTPARIQK